MRSSSGVLYIADKTSNQETSCATVDLDPLPLTSPARTADISFPSRINTKVSKDPLLLPASFGKIILDKLVVLLYANL
jgi:hypothetical protein